MRIVLVHGAWADGSSWAGVIRRLQAAGHEVIAPQLPHTSLADNVAKLRHVLTLEAEPTVVAGHSPGATERRVPSASSVASWLPSNDCR